MVGNRKRSVVNLYEWLSGIATREKPMRIPHAYVFIVCLACSGCADQFKGAILAGAYAGVYVVTIPQRLQAEQESGQREALRREDYGARNCPEAFVDICWEFDPADASSAPSAPPPWETYQKIVAHLREQPLPLDDKRCLTVYQGMRRALRNEPLTKKQQATVLTDAAQLVQSPKAGDGVSAAMLLSALTSTLLPARLHLSSPDERQLAGEVAALLVPAYERALAELSEAAQEAHWGSDFSLALAEICLGSAYEFAAFVEQNPAEKKRLLAKAFAVYARTTEIPNWYIQIMAGMFGSRTAATDGERLELARRLTAALSLELRQDSGWPYIYDHELFTDFYYFSFGVLFFLYEDARPGSEWAPFFRKPSELPGQTTLNLTILEIWENCESAEARRAAADILIGLYATGAPAGHTPKGAVAALLLEFYGRSGDGHWLRAAPGYLRAGGDSLSAGEWQELAEQARRQRAELVAQLDGPNLCRDADGLVIRLRGDLITDQRECAAAREFVARYPMVSEKRPSRLGAEYGTERYIWEHVSER
jgi:hypothetical protein